MTEGKNRQKKCFAVLLSKDESDVLEMHVTNTVSETH